jgi:hypothetical protein
VLSGREGFTDRWYRLLRTAFTTSKLGTPAEIGVVGGAERNLRTTATAGQEAEVAGYVGGFVQCYLTCLRPLAFGRNSPSA